VTNTESAAKQSEPSKGWEDWLSLLQWVQEGYLNVAEIWAAYLETRLLNLMLASVSILLTCLLKISCTAFIVV
jgi:hypothetical protein